MATVTHRVSTPLTTNVTSYASGAFTPAVGDLLVVFVSASDTAATGTMTGTGAGQSFTKVGSFRARTNVDTIYCFVGNSLVTVAASQTVTFDCTGDAATGAILQVHSVAGMTRTGLNGAIRQFNGTSNGAAGVPAVTFSAAALTGNTVLGAVMNATSPATLTPPTSFTEGGDVGYATPTTGAESAFRNSGHTSATVTWGSSSATAYGAIAVELDTTAAPKMATLVDDFNAGALDTTKWTDDGTSVSQSSGAAHLQANNYGNLGFWSDNWYDLTNSEIVVEIPALPTTDVTDGPFFGITLSAGNTNDPTNERLKWFWYSSSAGVGDWDPQYQNTGTTSSGTVVASSAATRWLRIKHDGTNILWDTSPDGTTWTNRRSVAIATVAVPYTAMRVSFAAGADAATSGTFDVGNVNTLGSTTWAAVGALSVTSTGVAAGVAVHEGSATLAVTAARTAAAIDVSEAGGTLAASAALAAAATRIGVQAADAVLAVSAALASAAVPLHQATDTLPVTAALASTAGAVHEATATLGATAGLVAAATSVSTQAATASLAVTAASVSAGAKTAPGAAALSVTSSSVSAGERVQSATSVLTVTAASAAGGERVQPATGALSVTSTQQATAFKSLEAASSLTVTAARAAAASAVHEGLSTLAVAAARVSAALRVQEATGSLTVTETGAAADTQVAGRAAALAVTAIFQADVEGIAGPKEAGGTLAVTAARLAAATRDVPALAPGTAAAALAATAARTVAATATLAATSTQASAAVATHQANASLTVTATRAADAAKTGQQDAQGALSATAGLNSVAAATRPAAGSRNVTAALASAAERGRVADAAGVVSAALAAEVEVVRAAEAVLAVAAARSAQTDRNVTAVAALNVTAETAAAASSIRPDIESMLDVPVEDHRVLVTSGASGATMVMNRREVTTSVGTREV